MELLALSYGVYTRRHKSTARPEAESAMLAVLFIRVRFSIRPRAARYDFRRRV
jgi:hypothetical protein